MKIRLYFLVDQILSQQKVYERYETYKQAIEAIFLYVFQDKNVTLDRFLCSAFSQNKSAQYREIRISKKTQEIIDSSHYLRMGIDKTVFVNAVILAYLSEQYPDLNYV